eukprot:gene5788-biopygen13348
MSSSETGHCPTSTYLIRGVLLPEVVHLFIDVAGTLGVCDFVLQRVNVQQDNVCLRYHLGIILQRPDDEEGVRDGLTVYMTIDFGLASLLGALTVNMKSSSKGCKMMQLTDGSQLNLTINTPHIGTQQVTFGQ